MQPPMSAGLVVSVIVCFVAFAMSLVVGPRIWRNEWGYAWDPAGGGAISRGFARTTPISGPALGMTGLLAVIDWLGDGRTTAIFAVASAIWVAMLVAAVTIVLFNRPKWLVAPHLRRQPGAVGEWLGRKVEPTPAPRHRPLRNTRRS
jgi:hypothetical protein